MCLLNNVEQVLAILGQLWLGQNNKEDLMKPDFHEGDEATDEQLIAYGKKEATDKEFIKEAVEHQETLSLSVMYFCRGSV